ncbi:hypothetical protein ITJ64_10545 [Herbiconiux sp. VKM Ac-1786]|uniref:hypothetical protein n=1 Tax=Herbiconiux sp. VKM Ac-1786 TaxID=2783824 RepID=UPI00188CA8C7|nr:hypothetical protein [Herbiconiux sp. VKM Ac-1786]MBF4572956.1 hypothetical protein [Herbiconiux sp. VKM Ac-1786]
MDRDFPPAPARAPDVEDRFVGGRVCDELWVAEYLPQWTAPSRSGARVAPAGASGVRLLIEEDQLDWREEDAPLRVSNLQTAVFSGPVGSERGTHRHRPGLRVRTAVPTRLLWTPSSGRVDVTVSASVDEGCMLAVWLVGVEEGSARDCGEICVVEIDAAAVGPSSVRARCGLKAHGDDRLETDMRSVTVPVGAARAHTWSVVWGPAGTVIGCEGRVVFSSSAAPGYPLQLMVDVFEIGPRSGASAYPKSAVVHAVRGWSGPL